MKILTILLFVLTSLCIISCEKEELNQAPEISNITFSTKNAYPGETIKAFVKAIDTDNNNLNYNWETTNSTISGISTNDTITIKLLDHQTATITAEVNDGKETATLSKTYQIAQPTFYDLFDDASNPWNIFNIDYSFSSGHANIKRSTESEKTYGMLRYRNFDNLNFYKLKTKFSHNKNLNSDDYLALRLYLKIDTTLTKSIQFSSIRWYIHPGSVANSTYNWRLYLGFYDSESKEYFGESIYGNTKTAILDELINLDGTAKEFKVELDEEYNVTLYANDFLVKEINVNDVSIINPLPDGVDLILNRELESYTYYIKNNIRIYIDNIYID
jgi:hypothetical protein